MDDKNNEGRPHAPYHFSYRFKRKIHRLSQQKEIDQMDILSCILLGLLVAAISICSLYYLLGRRSSNTTRLPPGPNPLPFIGNLLELGNKPHLSLTKLSQRYGPNYVFATRQNNNRVFVNAWAISRDPHIWDNPDSFDPERFLGSKIDVTVKNFELIPFGGGRRICPGLPLAVRMVNLMLGSLINCFDNWKLEDGIAPETRDMDEKFGITLQKAQSVRSVPML
ncbi:unnamed protein product [Malus baccata var. baccata]